MLLLHAPGYSMLSSSTSIETSSASRHSKSSPMCTAVHWPLLWLWKLLLCCCCSRCCCSRSPPPQPQLLLCSWHCCCCCCSVLFLHSGVRGGTVSCNAVMSANLSAASAAVSPQHDSAMQQMQHAHGVLECADGQGRSALEWNGCWFGAVAPLAGVCQGGVSRRPYRHNPSNSEMLNETSALLTVTKHNKQLVRTTKQD